jgi:hypothetical protein
LARRSAARAVANFPEAVRELLEDARRAGLTFEEAWERAMEQVRPGERGWGPSDCVSRGATETPFEVLRRAMRTAYEA